ncbi:dUTP diphosphatase [Algicella marina]|uniref:Deoxyuridine 5'-triphosphate nucleotidohydrolase n=1 Tax=Algicella marina TaxID=2683284 RepID=A0A6P1T5T8_9RHOB|nr:dUTP diphosphatase [Algicella marina]
MCTVAILRTEGADPEIPLPDYATAQAAGMDVHANFGEANREEGIQLQPGERALIPTGFSIALPPGYEMQLRPRSGLALRYGITLANAPGTIDADYRGEVGVILINHGSDTCRIKHGTRIAQFVVAPVLKVRWEEVKTLSGTKRGGGGFGSTGS